jgi:hypothetical protein
VKVRGSAFDLDWLSQQPESVDLDQADDVGRCGLSGFKAHLAEVPIKQRAS